MTFTVNDLDDAIEEALAHASWIEATTNSDYGTCDTIIMLDEDSSTFYIYVQITPFEGDPWAPQIDTLTYTEGDSK